MNNGYSCYYNTDCCSNYCLNQMCSVVFVISFIFFRVILASPMETFVLIIKIVVRDIVQIPFVK